MNIGMYSPYLPKHAGGGEKHFLTTAWYLSQSHNVNVLVPKTTTDLEAKIFEYQRLFNLDLSRITWQPSALASRQGNPFTRWQETKQYDVFWYATDGSVFLCGSPRSVLHIQIPFRNQQSGWFMRQKLQSWKIRNANSQFTKNVVEQSWQIDVPFIHYPYVDTAHIPFPAQKKKPAQILAVGRFFDPQHTDVHAKRQDVLIEAFVTAYEKHNWVKKKVNLVLVGGIEPDGVHAEFVRHLKQKAKGYPITFLHDVSYNKLHELYDESAVFWHAAGYGIDEEAQPQRVEHFGMSTIEAMAHGCIPVVVNRGGLKESVDHEVNGFRFETTVELGEITQKVLRMGKKPLERMARAARKKAEQFSLEQFCRTVDAMMEA